MRLSEGFMFLLRSSLGTMETGDHGILANLDQEAWKDIQAASVEQSVSGLVGDAVSLLPDDVEVPDQILYFLLAERERTDVRNRALCEKACRVCRIFTEAGLDPLIMKGPAIAAFYPKPELRSFGDIDLYFRTGEFKKARTMAAKDQAVRMAGDGSFHFSFEGVDVDVHNRYYDLHCKEVLLPTPPSPEASLIMISSHVLKHACGTGAGLRQICDMAMAYRALDGEYDPGTLEKAYKAAGIMKWNILLSSFIINRLGIDAPLFGHKPVSDKPLTRIIEEGGNFGHHSKGRKKALEARPLRRKADTVLRFFSRLPFSLKYAPRETFRTISTLTKGNLGKY